MVNTNQISNNNSFNCVPMSYIFNFHMPFISNYYILLNVNHKYDPPVCCQLFVVEGLPTSITLIAMLAGVFILLLGPPKPGRLKDRGQTK